MLTYRDDFQKFLKLRDSGARVEIDRELFFYFLEILPPVRMRWNVAVADGTRVCADFGFAEGAELITAFWQQGDRYFAQLTNCHNPG